MHKLVGCLIINSGDPLHPYENQGNNKCLEWPFSFPTFVPFPIPFFLSLDHFYNSILYRNKIELQEIVNKFFLKLRK